MKTIDKILDKIQQLESAGVKPKYIVLDQETWEHLRSNVRYHRSAVRLGEEQKDQYEPHKIYDIPLTILTGFKRGVVEVVS